MLYVTVLHVFNVLKREKDTCVLLYIICSFRYLLIVKCSQSVRFVLFFLFVLFDFLAHLIICENQTKIVIFKEVVIPKKKLN